MSGSDERGGFNLHRWSRRKHAAKREAARPVAPPAAAATASAPVPIVAAATAPVAAPPDASAAQASAPRVASPELPTLPPIESLTPQSDFTPFLHPGVDDSLKRAALKKLFADPHFNVMDGLDVYIDDYSKPDPIPPDMLAKLLQNRALFDPPRTRVNADGVVEEMPAAEVAAPAAEDASPPATDADPPPPPADASAVDAPRAADPAEDPPR